LSSASIAETKTTSVVRTSSRKTPYLRRQTRGLCMTEIELRQRAL